MAQEQQATVRRGARPRSPLRPGRAIDKAFAGFGFLGGTRNGEGARIMQRTGLLPVVAFVLASALWVPLTQADVLLGISKGPSGYELREVDARSGESHLIKAFSFDSPFWHPASFTVSPDGSRAFAVSKTRFSPLLGGLFTGNTLYEFASNDGDLVSIQTLDSTVAGEIEALHALSSEKLLGITSRHALVEIEAATGELRVLSKVSFDSGQWCAETFTVDPSGSRAFAVMRGNRHLLAGKTWYTNTLYEFDLSNGEILSARSLDTPNVAEIEALHALSPKKLVGISGEHALVEIEAATGKIQMLNTVRFDSGHWYPASFTVSAEGSRALAVSKTHYSSALGKTLFGNTLYEFDLISGDLVSTRLLGKFKVGEIETLAFVSQTNVGPY